MLHEPWAPTNWQMGVRERQDVEPLIKVKNNWGTWSGQKDQGCIVGLLLGPINMLLFFVGGIIRGGARGMASAVGGCHVADLELGGKILFVVLSDVVVCCAW